MFYTLVYHGRDIKMFKTLKWILFHLSYEHFDIIFYSIFMQQTTLSMGLPAWQPTRDVGRTREDLVNHEPKASDLQLSFSSVLPTSQVGSHAGKPIESVVYCFYKITLKHVLVVYEFTGTINLVPRTFPLGTSCGTINHRFLTNQNARTILVIL